MAQSTAHRMCTPLPSFLQAHFTYRSQPQHHCWLSLVHRTDKSPEVVPLINGRELQTSRTAQGLQISSILYISVTGGPTQLLADMVLITCVLQTFHHQNMWWRCSKRLHSQRGDSSWCLSSRLTGSFFGEFLCSPSACEGFLNLLTFPPTFQTLLDVYQQGQTVQKPSDPLSAPHLGLDFSLLPQSERL